MTINLFWLLAALLLLNIRMCWLMFWDKYIAQRNARSPNKKRRIPERTLLWNAALFASVGAISGMLAFRHKTRKNHFVFGFAILLLLQTALFYIGKTYLERTHAWDFVFELPW